MSQIVPEGCFQQCHLLQWLVAASRTFREVVEKPEPALAVKHAHYPACNLEEEGHYPPWALINDETDFSSTREGTSYFREEGTIRISFDLFAPSDCQTERARHDWYSFVTGKILDEMREVVLSGVEGPIKDQTHLNMTNWRRVEGPFEIDAEDFDIHHPEDQVANRQLMHARFEISYR